MDRRHLVLAVAVGATIATSYDSDSSGGYQSLTVETLSIDGQETRSWVITGEVELPPEAEGEAFDSMLSIVAQVTGSEGLQHVSLVARDCDGGEIVAQAVVADEPGGGSWSGGQVDVPDFFRDCPVDECVRTVCLDVTNDTTSPAEVDLEVDASVTSEAIGGVGIHLTVEEIEP